MSDQWTRIRELFRRALDLEPAQWEAYLQTQCPEDAQVRERVAAMLREYGSNDGFLESPVAGAGRRVFESSDPASLVGRRIGAYEIKRSIAQGGMGVVFEAMDVKLKKKVALKMMNPGLMRDATFQGRFEQEAQLLARLEDPHFVRVHALIEAEGNAFIVMEYVDGVTLAHRIRAQGRLPAREVAGMGIQLLQALGKAHRQGVIHRDLKPSNIMLTRTDEGRSIVKVLDFGIAKSLQADAGQTRTQGAVGTLYYMSPEQARGLPDIDHRTDLYSLGVTLYEALSGELPFDLNTDEFSVRRDIVEGRVIPIASLRTDAPPALLDVIEKAMATDPVDRFQTSEEMQKALRQAFVEAPPASSVQAQAGPQKKRPVLVLAGIIVALLAAVAVGYNATRSPDNPEPRPIPPTTIDTTEIAQITPESEASVQIDSVETASELQIDGLVPEHSAQQPADEGAAIVSRTEDESPASSIVSNPSGESIEENQDTTTALDTVSVPALNKDTASVIEPPVQVELPPGRVQFQISPLGGDVYIDGNLEERGVMNQEMVLPAGTHTYRIENEGDAWQCTISVSSGQQSRVSVDFTRSVGVTITAVSAENSEALGHAGLIFIDGAETTYRTPQRVLLTPGIHEIKVQLDGYEYVGIVAGASGGCFQQIGPSSMNFDPSFNEGEVRVRARLRALR